MTYSDDLREFLKRWEGGPFLSPHWDAIGKVWDIGYGHVIQWNEDRRDITPAEAEMLLDFDLQIYDDGVNALVTLPVAQCQHDALVAFAYNVGLDRDDDGVAEGLGDSTLLRLVNRGDFSRAADEFGKWVNSGGRPVSGLVRRRAAERAIFEHDDYSGRP